MTGWCRCPGPSLCGDPGRRRLVPRPTRESCGSRIRLGFVSDSFPCSRWCRANRIPPSGPSCGRFRNDGGAGTNPFTNCAETGHPTTTCCSSAPTRLSIGFYSCRCWCALGVCSWCATRICCRTGPSLCCKRSPACSRATAVTRRRLAADSSFQPPANRHLHNPSAWGVGPFPTISEFGSINMSTSRRSGSLDIADSACTDDRINS